MRPGHLGTTHLYGEEFSQCAQRGVEAQEARRLDLILVTAGAARRRYAGAGEFHKGF